MEGWGWYVVGGLLIWGWEGIEGLKKGPGAMGWRLKPPPIPFCPTADPVSPPDPTKLSHRPCLSPDPPMGPDSSPIPSYTLKTPSVLLIPHGPCLVPNPLHRSHLPRNAPNPHCKPCLSPSVPLTPPAPVCLPNLSNPQHTSTPILTYLRSGSHV